ncbi:hypothetical protein G6O67_007971 [Ophiocordyceps sinensis]|uniref:Uncharacterized protein n=1 Tax=Ophiocordyceps sinensis TaxID=72228 RepID=A0A8H4LTB3_9HYPO|nr:hypothetical protein G6O67_007971 [Ophiocordyceps sinensis]
MDKSSRLADTMYHSFNDIELLEPPLVSSPPSSRDSSSSPSRRDSSSSPGSRDSSPSCPRQAQPDHHGTTPRQANERQPVRAAAAKMQRQDSGYESYGATPRPSVSQARPSVPARPVSDASSAAAGSPSRLRTPRPSTHRSAKSFPQFSPSRPHASRVPLAAFFQFPTPDLVELTETSSPRHDRRREQPPAIPQPPQTTHYWTSDRTRRLEYAAIDAAGRGVKGWVRRNLVPECFGPRHVAFDDDSGSVRRYRLELEDDRDEKSPRPGLRRSWQFWPLLGKSKTL